MVFLFIYFVHFVKQYFNIRRHPIRSSNRDSYKTVRNNLMYFRACHACRCLLVETLKTFLIT